MFWRDQTGAEVDWIIEKENHFISVEIKWTTNPSTQDTRHEHTFIEEYSNSSCGDIFVEYLELKN